MFSAESFLTSTLGSSSSGASVTRILAAAVNAVEPGAAVRRFVNRQGQVLTVAGQTYDLSTFRRVVLLGIGKASLAMTRELANILGTHPYQNLVITKHLPSGAPASQAGPGRELVLRSGDHPLPGEKSLQAGKELIELVSTLDAQDLLICLISGGGSALVTAPVEAVSLEDMQALTSALLACGARIGEINTLRRRLDQIKGGGIVQLANGAAILSLILSDVVGNPLEAIASGPTFPDSSQPPEAFSILQRYDLESKIPASITRALHSEHKTILASDPAFAKVRNVIIGSNLLAAQAALKQAEEEGMHPYLLHTDLQGEARQAAFELVTCLRQARRSGDPVPVPACIVAGGETTVTLQGNGVGGRNTELALAAVRDLADFPGVMLVSLATDGEDGPTDAAGAVVTGDTFRRAASLGMDPTLFLKRNDSYTFFDRLGDLLRPGPTGTNVNDLVFLFTINK